ncbi:MAG TPA: sulfatase, partial [Thermoanaerobaculia bacterium]|nr:sulfatase [Thermoanaerobaculia bacterium]
MGASFLGWEGGQRCASAQRPSSASRSAGVGLALCVLLGATGCSRDSTVVSSGPANVLLVTLDTVRADRLGSYGYAGASTPALDGLAREGIRFSQAVATAPLTLPSHASILTGLFPPRHAVHQNGAAALPPTVPTLAEALHGHGYRTAAFVGSFVLDARFGLDRGFELYDDDIPRDPTTAVPGLEAERPGTQVVDRALSWLNADDQRPFFVWVHLYDAHAPYEPPEPYRSRFADRPYDGEIASVDAQVGRLLSYLDERGLAGDTIVAVAADHGEALGEHGELTHGLLLFEPTVRVPLLLRAPGRLPGGVVVGEPVGLADLAPTLAGLAGVHLGLPSSSVDGRDLSASLAAGDEPPRVDLYAETEYPRLFGWSALAAIRRGHAKYVAAPTPRLFDLESDPGETSNTLQAGDHRPAALAEALASLQAEGVAAAPPVESELDA